MIFVEILHTLSELLWNLRLRDDVECACVNDTFRDCFCDARFRHDELFSLPLPTSVVKGPITSEREYDVVLNYRQSFKRQNK